MTLLSSSGTPSVISASPGDGDSSWSSSREDHEQQQQQQQQQQSKRPEQLPHQAEKTTSKQKRSQYSSCDACRLRKTRCIREDRSVACNGCTRRGIVCTNAFVNQRTVVKGKRVVACRKTFGTTGSVVDGASASKALVRAGTPGTVCGNPIVEDMNGLVLSSNALERFLRLYKLEVHDELPNLDIFRLTEACKEVDFDMHKLDSEDQILSLCAIAAAMAVSSEDTADILSLKDPLPTSKTIVRRTIELADQHGILRKPTRRSVQAMRLLQMLTSGDEATEFTRSDTYEAFSRGFASHLRKTIATGETSEEEAAVHVWSILLGDSFGAALSGCRPCFDQEDFELFVPYWNCTTQTMISLISEFNLRKIDTGFSLVLGRLCTLAREMYARISSASAKSRPLLDLDMMEQIPAEVEELSSVLNFYEQRLTRFYGAKWPKRLAYCSKVARFSFTYIDTMAVRAMDEGLVKELSTASASSLRLARLLQVQNRVQTQFARDLVDNADFIVFSSTKRVIGMIDSLISYFAVLRLQKVLKLPAFEEVGRESVGIWSVKDKMKCAEYYYSDCETLARSVLALQNALPNLRKDVDEFLARARSLLPGESTMTTMSSLLNLPSNPASEDLGLLPTASTSNTTSPLITPAPFDFGATVPAVNDPLLQQTGHMSHNLLQDLTSRSGSDIPPSTDPAETIAKCNDVAFDFDFEAMQRLLNSETAVLPDMLESALPVHDTSVPQ